MRNWLVGVVLLLAACGLPADSVREIEQLRDGAAALADDQAATQRERETGWAVSDALWQLLYSVGEAEALPEDVRARREARKPKDPQPGGP